MSNLSDFHIHTCFSSDSDENPENIIRQAVTLGLSSICFTDHNDFDFPLEDGKVIFLVDFDKYHTYFEKLREKYRNQLDIYIGIEQGLQKCCKDKVNSYDPDKYLDFIIGSSHLVDGSDPYYKDFWNGRSTMETIMKYFESILENLKCCHNFDVYGHIDYIIRYAPGQNADYDWKDYQDVIDDILKTLIHNGKGIEINTAGLKYGLKDPNPCFGIVKRYRQLGGEIITTGSDAHKAEHLAYNFNIIHDFLREAGFKYYTIFKKRKPEFIAL